MVTDIKNPPFSLPESGGFAVGQNRLSSVSENRGASLYRWMRLFSSIWRGILNKTEHRGGRYYAADDYYGQPCESQQACRCDTIVGKTSATNLIKLIPGAGTIMGGAASAGTAGVITLALGKAYIQVCKAIKMGELDQNDLTKQAGIERLKKEFKEQMAKKK